MMTYIYVLKNRKMGIFTFPFNAPYAKKDMAEVYRRQVLEGTVKANQAEEMDLYQLGTFEDTNCEMRLSSTPDFVCSLADFVPKKELEDNGECRDKKQA